jgi:hypothetical protein
VLRCNKKGVPGAGTEALGLRAEDTGRGARGGVWQWSAGRGAEGAGDCGLKKN